MHPDSFFCRSCPVCGRPLEIPSECAGQEIACPHCFGRFTAPRPPRRASVCVETRSSLLEQADRLLSLSTEWLLGAAAPV
jgi:hypothetical protein